MSTSSSRPRRPTCSSPGCLPLLVLCLTWLVACDQLRQNSFVQGLSWQWHGPTGVEVGERSGQHCHALSGKAEADVQKEARRLTLSIKKAYSAEKLLNIFDEAVDGPIFNLIHASAACTQLVTFKRRKGLGKREWDSPVLCRLHARVEDMVLKDQVGARETANVFWSIAQLSDRFSIPTKLLIALVKSVPSKVQGMDEQNLSNTLWACAKLKEIAPDVLEAVPAIVAQMKIVAKDMVPQALSNCLWASAQLKDVAPDVLEAVPAIVAQIPGKAQDMKPQELSNCLWASAQLKDEAPEVLEAVPAIVMQIPRKAKDLKPQHLSNTLFASVQLKNEVPKVLEIIPAIVGEIPLKLQDMKPQEMSNSLEALVFLRDSVSEVAGFLAAGGDMDGILKCAAARLNTLLPGLKGKDLSFAMPVVIWACAKAGVYDGELLGSVARRLGSRSKMGALQGFNLCALSWAYQVLGTDAFDGFKRLLMSETEKRGFSEADVQSCQFGRSEWNYR